MIKGFATTGTPHQGSPLGRFYQYMHDNCIPKSVYRQDGSSRRKRVKYFVFMREEEEARVQVNSPTSWDLVPKLPSLLSFDLVRDILFSLPFFSMPRSAYFSVEKGLSRKPSG